MTSKEESLAPDFIGLLRCPLDKARLTSDAGRSALVCTRCGKTYAVREDIPILLDDTKGDDEKKA